MKLLDTDLRVLRILWRDGDTSAKQISDILSEEVGWNINTTYTVIRRCIERGMVERREPGFICHVLVEEETLRVQEARSLMNRLFDGSPSRLVSTLIRSKAISQEELDALRKMIEQVNAVEQERG